MIDWKEREELAKRTNDKKLLMSVYQHKRYMGDRENKFTQGDCQRIYGKPYRELSDKDRKEYHKIKQREHRAKFNKPKEKRKLLTANFIEEIM